MITWAPDMNNKKGIHSASSIIARLDNHDVPIIIADISR